MSFRRFAAICLLAGTFGIGLSILVAETARPAYDLGAVSFGSCATGGGGATCGSQALQVSGDYGIILN